MGFIVDTVGDWEGVARRGSKAWRMLLTWAQGTAKAHREVGAHRPAHMPAHTHRKCGFLRKSGCQVVLPPEARQAHLQKKLCPLLRKRCSGRGEASQLGGGRPRAEPPPPLVLLKHLHCVGAGTSLPTPAPLRSWRQPPGGSRLACRRVSRFQAAATSVGKAGARAALAPLGCRDTGGRGCGGGRPLEGQGGRAKCRDPQWERLILQYSHYTSK